MNSQLAALMRGFEDKYPHKLDETYPRIVEKMVELWRSPEKMEAYFNELMIADHHDRQGFPPEVASELFSLGNVYEKILAQADPDDDVWQNELNNAKDQLENLNIQFTAQSFFKMLSDGNAKEVVLFLNAGMDLEQRDQRGWTPLMIAAFEGREELALLLIEHGADAFARDKKGYMPIHFAAYRNFTEVISRLLHKGADPDTQSEAGTTPLLQAAARGNIEAVNQLLKASANPNKATNDGWTPLHKATSNRHVPVISALMKYRANPHARHNSGATPISIATENGYTEILTLLSNDE